MSGRSEYREMTMTLVGPVDGYPVDKTDGYVSGTCICLGSRIRKKVLPIPPGQVDFLAGIFFRTHLPNAQGFRQITI